MAENNGSHPLLGSQGIATQEVAAQQYPGVRPPSGWVPPLDAPSDTIVRIMAVYNNATGYWVGLPLQVFTEALVWAEFLTPIGKIDTRNAITLTVPLGTAVGVYATRATIVVPAGEVWFLDVLELITPVAAGGTTSGNFRISSWTDDNLADVDGKAFWAADQGNAVGGNYYAECHIAAPMWALGDQIGTPIKLEGGDIITLCASVTVLALTAAQVLTLNPFGWKAKRLVR